MKFFPSLTGHPIYLVLAFIAKRAILVGLTVFIGLGITVIIANQNNVLEENLSEEIRVEAIRTFRETTPDQNELTQEERSQRIDTIELQMREEVGLEDPFLLRQLRWAFNALTFNWGDITYLQFRAQVPSSREALSVTTIVLRALPNTLLLVGIANLIVFVVGLPLALNLSRQPGSRMDRFMSVLAPLSTFPSWVIGLVLILIFAIQLRWLPASSVQPVVPNASSGEALFETIRRLILPVSAITISLFFQFVYTWRSYLLSFAEEDYVTLAKARGLPNRMLEQKHILRPSLAFIVTSFMLSLVGFWQMAIALEVVFEWPGIGLLYIDSLPNFWGESMFPGEMVITIAMVTTFAYLLGLTVILLEVFYALIDPRVRVDQPLQLRLFRRRQGASLSTDVSLRPMLDAAARLPANILAGLGALPARLASAWAAAWAVVRQFRKFPAAMVGLVIIVGLVIGSAIAILGFPYDRIGVEWYSGAVTGRTYRPVTAMPTWLNWGREQPLLSTLVMNSDNPADLSTQDGANSSRVTKEVELNPDTTRSIILRYEFDFNYGELPQEAFLYFDSDFAQKRPFLFWKWITPDGRDLELIATTDPGHLKVPLTDFVFRGPSAVQRAVAEYPQLAGIETEQLPLYFLFTDPEDPAHHVVPGHYTLEIEARQFEDDADIDAEFVMLGQVYGPAGTDGFRRDLLVPLLWGMPFALVFGLGAALISVFVALLLGAAAVWYGGIVDWAVQRLTDLNMVLPILAISVVFFAYYNLDIWLVLMVIVLFTSFGSPVKTFRSAFLQVKEESYIEAARSYGASDSRIIFRYMIPKIMPLLIPQLIYLIPTFVFLEATLGMFNIRMVYPTWGRIIYDALTSGLNYGSRYWVLQPLVLVFLTGLAFSMVGFALDKILNPKLDNP
jgi:peptide/nickel transport system permease protein